MKNTDDEFFYFFWLTVVCMLVNVLMIFLSGSPYCWYHLALAIINAVTLRFLWVISPMFYLGSDTLKKKEANEGAAAMIRQTDLQLDPDDMYVMCVKCKDTHLFKYRRKNKNECSCPKCGSKSFVVAD